MPSRSPEARSLLPTDPHAAGSMDAAAATASTYAADPWGWAAVRSAIPGVATGILHPVVLQCTLQFLPPTVVCSVSRVSTSFAHATRSDALWERILARDWSLPSDEFLGDEGGELQRRVQAEARARRGVAPLCDAEVEARRKSSLADTPPSRRVRSGEEAAPFSATPPTPLLAKPAQRRNHDDGMPRARSIAALNTLVPSTSSTAAALGGVGVGLSSGLGVTTLSRGVSASPRASPRAVTTIVGKVSPDSGESSTDGNSPLKRAYSEGTSLQHIAAFNFGSPCAIATAGVAAFSPLVRSPSGSARSNTLAAQRWTAPPESLKAIYAHVVHASYPRFQLAHHLDVAQRWPRQLKCILMLCAVVLLVAGFSLWRLPSETRILVQPQRFDGVSGLPFDTHAHFLSLLCTLSCTVGVCALSLHVVRILSRSRQAKRALWTLPPLPPADASIAEHEHAAAVAAFALADQAWWRQHYTNRFYSVRYQVWAAPHARGLLILMSGLGSFVLLWCGTTLSLGAYWPSFGVSLGALWPGVSLVFAFQLGRMVHLGRTWHLVSICVLSLSQLCTLIYLLHAGNPCLLWLIHYSPWVSFLTLLLSFAPNLLLLFFSLWINEEYITHGWTPVILPPGMDLADSGYMADAGSKDDEGWQQQQQQQEYARSPMYEELAMRSGREMDEEAQMPVQFSASSSSSTGACNSCIRRLPWRPSDTPPAHTFGRVLLGSEFERRVLERHLPLSLRRLLFSRLGLSALAGLCIYLSTCTLWSPLFSLFLDPGVLFPALPLSVRAYFVSSLVMFLVVSVLLSLLAVLISLQNRNWQWWWVCVYANVAATLAVAAHFFVWVAQTREGMEGVLSMELQQVSAAGNEDGGAAAVRAAAAQHAIRLFHSQMSAHWLYSGSSWIASLCCTSTLAFSAGVVAMRMLYCPKSVRELLKSAAAAAARAEEEEAQAAHRAYLEQSMQQKQPVHSVPRDLYPIMTPSARLSLSHLHAFASPRVVDSLASLSMQDPAFDARLASCTSSPLSFLQALQQPASPAVDVQDGIFMQHLQEVQEHAREAQLQQQQHRRYNFPEIA